MSRSYKKYPWIKDNQTDLKKYHSGIMRSRTKHILRVYRTVWKTEEEPDFPHFRSGINQYDICDWKTWVEYEDNKECALVGNNWRMWFIWAKGHQRLRK